MTEVEQVVTSLKIESDVKAAFVCTIDETDQAGPNMEHLGKMGSGFASIYSSLAEAVIAAREFIPLGLYPKIQANEKTLDKCLSFLAYSFEHPDRRKKEPMNVKGMVETWEPLIKKLALAHTVDEKDAASARLDDLLLPVVSAPVAQIREFYTKLTEALKADPEVPLFLYRLFEFWGESVLSKIDNSGVLTLKKEIASRIAERSIEEIPKQDWIESMVGALQWRDPEKLKEIETKLDAGEKPRVRGRESCLFLEVGESQVML